MAFKINKESEVSLESPESLFHDLRNRKVQGLLSHQADIIRQYHDKYSKSSNLAIQLPTGSGKTLIGLLIAEWRRKKFNQKSLYLCPTNQLVNQVCEQAKEKYGINAISFTGSKRKYDQVSVTEYLAAEKIGVTSYSSLFNINPFFDSPGLIILDDAHSSENYIASNWSVEIDRFQESTSSLYKNIAALLRPHISSSLYRKLSRELSSYHDFNAVDKLPFPIYLEIESDLLDIIEEHIHETDQKYSWHLIKDYLFACNFYISPLKFLIRPLIPPTNTHKPFSQAQQRIYMSATLGEGGDLERITGQVKIDRLSIPRGWDKQGIGRRLFFFPETSSERDNKAELFFKLAKISKRSLVITESDRQVNEICQVAEDKYEFNTFTIREIESSKKNFVSSDNAISVVANRYDGIDFPDDECRLILISGVPRATNLQESFIVNRFGAVILLNDRILTRIVQGFGRCTRNPTDYALIMIFGEELHKYLLSIDRRSFLHPEIQAELAFGIEQSKEIDADEFCENFEIFLEQDEEWQEADKHILSMRDNLIKKDLPGTESLRNSVKSEVKFVYALWNKDVDLALTEGQKVLGELTGKELRGYRALWNYMLGNVCWIGYKMGESSLQSKANEYYTLASKATMGVSWLNTLTKQNIIKSEDEDFDPDVLSVIERLESKLEDIGTLHDGNYRKIEKEIIDGINDPSNSQVFEEAHKKLGDILGYESGNVETQGAPDPWWLASDNLCFVFEDYTSGISEEVPIDKIRQANGHEGWIRDHLDLDEDATVFTILLTNREKIDQDAHVHLENIFYWNLGEFQEWAHNALSINNELRSKYTETGNLTWRAEAAQKYSDNFISPGSLKGYFLLRSAKKKLVT